LTLDNKLFCLNFEFTGIFCVFRNAKKITIEIKECVEFLQKEHSNAKGVIKKDRIKTLLYIKQEKYHFQSDIGKKLGRIEKTVRDWIKEYVELGFSTLLEVKSGGNNTRTISDKANIYLDLNFIIPKLLQECDNICRTLLQTSD